MDLYEKIDAEIKDAMRSKDTVRLSVMRMLLAAVKNTEITKKVKKLEEPDILTVIQKMIKEHKESISQFEKGSRQDLVSRERAELEILQRYVPAQISEEELSGIVKSVIQEIGVTSKSEAGKAIKAVMEKVKGRADGKIVNQLITSLLK